jgi:outer membrane protein TolC
MTRLIPLILVLLIPDVARAQAPDNGPAITLTLQDALARGLAASRRLAEAAARGEAAEAAVAQRRAATLPQVSARAGYVRTNHVEEFGILLPNNQIRIIYPDVPDNYQTRLDLQWAIYSGGRAEALERAARAEADAAGRDLDAARADLRLEITRAYWALVSAAESERVVEQSVARMTAHLADARNQLDAGLIPPSDVLSVEAQRSRQRMLAAQARSLRDNAEAQLAYLIGAPAGASITASSPLDIQPAAPAQAEALIDEARRRRDERAALTARALAAGERAGAARAGRRPTIAVSGGVDYARPNPRIFPREDTWHESWDAGVSVSWPLYDGGRTSAELAEALAASRAANARLEDFDRSLALELRQRLNDAVSARAAIEAANDGVRAAAEARRVVGDRFAAGVATNTDLIDAQVALLQAELDRTQAISAARLADARLARAVGQ